MSINRDGKLVIDVKDIFDNLSRDTMLELIERLACSEIVIKHVADQLLDGWTENGYHGSMCSELKPSLELDIARDRIAKGAGDVALKRIKELETLVENANNLAKSGWDSYHELKNKGE